MTSKYISWEFASKDTLSEKSSDAVFLRLDKKNWLAIFDNSKDTSTQLVPKS